MKNYDTLYGVESIDMRSMSLHEVTSRYGFEGLRQQFMQYAHDLDAEIDEKQSIFLALDVANVVHDGQMRGAHPYTTHLLRVSSRIINHFGVEDPDIIKAALLHDSVEDNPGRLIFDKRCLNPKKVMYRPQALQSIADMFGENVSRMVSSLTNPKFNPRLDASEEYRKHVIYSMESNPEARIIKMSDFLDNCKGLNHNELSPERVKRLASKYSPLIPVMREFALDESTPLPDYGREYIVSSLVVAKERCDAVTTGQ